MRSAVSMPKVSIIIPFYNDPYINEAVMSAIGQTYPNTEVIVVDDGSTRHQEKLAPYLNRIHYIGKANGGTASALNYGMSLASGKYVAWLSSDDRFKSDKIAKQVAYMEATGARISHTDYDLMNEFGSVYETKVAPKYNSSKAFISTLLNGCVINGCTIMMTKELFVRMGGFNDQLPYTHDYEMWIRVVLAGIDFHFINESLTIYRRHPGMGTARHFNTVLAEANSVTNLYRHALTALIARIPG
ncbi:glycosyltransferase family 2 protein [Paenibacillus xylaniclasticus]|uniref:glycosyltransferase family 2 protein n=1 Tax=Paenibacillus xylaniclasticus TaxID=588083 RepID=UPI000FDB4275|nr:MULTISPECIES: glycosyltransferase [Paenibacillus]GFN31021.1 glycosyl transferase family 2 [Paenibacillus curdlanolyticus]